VLDKAGCLQQPVLFDQVVFHAVQGNLVVLWIASLLASRFSLLASRFSLLASRFSLPSHNNDYRSVKNQRGATLLVSLVLLLLLTLLALVSSRTATLQQRMAGNFQQQNLAFYSADGGISVALFRLNKEAAKWPLDAGFTMGESKSLCGTMNEFAGWAATSHCSLSAGSGYQVRVTRVACEAAPGDICFDIASNGIYEQHRVLYQQGALLEQFRSECAPNC